MGSQLQDTSRSSSGFLSLCLNKIFTQGPIGKMGMEVVKEVEDIGG